MAIDGQWELLDATAARLSSGATDIASDAEVMGADWQALRGGYQDSATQEVVWSAFDQVPQVSREWASVVAGAAGVLQGFAAEAKSAQAQAEALQAGAARLEAELAVSDLLTGGTDAGDQDADGGESAQDQLLRARIREHNDAVTSLGLRWQNVQDQAISELEALTSGGGLAEDIPQVTADGADMTGSEAGFFNVAGGSFAPGMFGVATAWSTGAGGLSFAPGFPLASLTQALVASSSVQTQVEEVLDEINAENDGDFGQWAAENEERAAEFSGNELTEDSVAPEGAEQFYDLTQKTPTTRRP